MCQRIDVKSTNAAHERLYTTLRTAVMAFIVTVGLGLCVDEANAHSEYVHARLVVEAQRFMEQAPEYKDVVFDLAQAGWTEASTNGFGALDTCSFGARTPEIIASNINLVAREACQVDHYRDMTVDILPDDLSDIFVILGDTADDFFKFADNLASALTECTRLDRTMLPIVEVPLNCAFSVLAALLTFGADGLGDQIALMSFPAAIGVKFIGNAAGVDFGISHIGGAFNFTSFNHLQHVEEGAWASTSKNDQRGYSLPKDPSGDSILETGALRATAWTVGESLSGKIIYDASEALHRYKQNGSRLTKSDFANKLVSRVEYEPMDNMATYGMIKALSTGNLTYLGLPLHVAGDATVPFHTIGHGGVAHTDYESYVLDHWDTKAKKWISYERIRYYLADSKLSPNLPAQAIVTNAARMVKDMSFDEKSDTLHQERISIGIAAMVALFAHYHRAKNGIAGVQSEITSSAASGLYFSTYPYPESKHSAAKEAPDASFDWFESEARLKGRDACSTMKVTFSKNTSGTSNETVTIYSYPKIADMGSTRVRSMPVNELSNKTITLNNAAGFSIRYQRSNTDQLGWGFRVTKVTCD